MRCVIEAKQVFSHPKNDRAAGKMGAPLTVEPLALCLVFFFFMRLRGAHPKTVRAFLTCRAGDDDIVIPFQALVACLIWLGFIEGAPLLRSVTDLPDLPALHPTLP